MAEIKKSNINMKSKISSKNLSSNEAKEFTGVNLKQSTILISDNLRDFNKKYEYYLDKEIKNNLSKSTNYLISINNQIINGNRIENKNIIIEEENKSIDILELIYKNKVKFYEKVKELIIPKNIDNKEIKNEEEYIIEEIKKLIVKKKRINKEKDDIIKFDNKTLVFSHNQNISIKSNINSDNNEKQIELIKTNIDNNFKEIKKEIIMEDRNYIANLDNNKIDDIKKLKESINNSDKFLPEIISPKNLYTIFMYCIKQFDYEKKLYIKFLNKEDLIILFEFAKKFKKYIKRVFSTLLNNENK